MFGRKKKNKEDLNSDFENEFNSNGGYPQPMEIPIKATEQTSTNTERQEENIPDYIIRQQEMLAYIEQNEGLETDEGEHYYKLAMCYFNLQKACYRPLLIKNLEKYLVSKPYVAKYKDYIIHYEYLQYNQNFTSYPKCKNEMELAERNFLRQVYYFLARAYQQEGDTDNAFKYLKLGMDIIPEGHSLFIIELYETCRKANKLPYFIQYYKEHPTKNDYSHLVERANKLIESGYVFKPRKNKASNNLG